MQKQDNLSKCAQLYKDFCVRSNVFPQKTMLVGLNQHIIDICDANKWEEPKFDPLLKVIHSNPPLTFLAVRTSYDWMPKGRKIFCMSSDFNFNIIVRNSIKLNQKTL